MDEKNAAETGGSGCGRQVVSPITIPEIQETVDISKRVVETGTVRITKRVHEEEKTFMPELREERVNVERVAVNRLVNSPPAIRTEGKTTVIPVVEEVLVKMLLVREELHITREMVPVSSPQQVVSLRREEIDVQRSRPNPT